LPTRAWQLGAGGLIALTATRWQHLSPRSAIVTGWAGLVLILLSCAVFSDTTLYPGVAALLPTLGTVLVIGAGCATPTQGCGRILGTSPMRAIGRISYSWYLWHWPVLLLAPIAIGQPLGLPARLTAALVSGGLAVLTLRVVENPLRFAAPIHRSARVSLALGGAATAVAVGVGAALLVVVPVPVGRGAPAASISVDASPVPSGSGFEAEDAAVLHAFSQVQAGVAASAGLKAVPSNLNPPLADAAAESWDMFSTGCMRDLWHIDLPDCAMGDPGSATTVVVIGDSHAAVWNPAFREVAEQRHWRVEMLTKADCPALDLRFLSSQMHRPYTECEQWRQRVMARLGAEPPLLVVLGMSRGYGHGNNQPVTVKSYGPGWIESLTNIVQQIRGYGSAVLVLGPTPDPGSIVPICLSGHLDDATACAPNRSAAVNGRGIAAESAATRAGGGDYADITDLFCTPDRCPVIVGNTLVFLDGGHVTMEYSRVLAPVIGALADRALAQS
jgi:hypothetical protein